MDKDKVLKCSKSATKNIASASPFVLVLSAAVFLIYIFAMSFSSIADVEDGALGILNSNNTIKYFFGIIVFAVSFLLFRFASRFIPNKVSDALFECSMPKTVNICAMAVCLISFCIYMYIYLFHTELEGGVFGATPIILQWHNVPLALVIGCAGAVVIWVVWSIYKNRDSHVSACILVYFIAALLTYYSLLYINLLDTHHGIAYTESIYAVYSGVPYNAVTTGIYGHYGIFYGLLLRLFSGNFLMLSHMIAFVGAISTLACAYIIHNLVKKNHIRIVTILSCILSVCVLRYRNYWQIQPHRVLFPLIIIAYLVYLYKKGKYNTSRIVVGYVICVGSIIWNTEGGMFCAVAYTLALIVHFWQSEIWYSKKMWLIYGGVIGAFVASLIAAIATVNVYNLAVGGGLIFKEFFFPMFENDYMNRVLKHDLIDGVQVWPLVLVLFVVLLFVALVNTKFFRRENEKHDTAAPVYIATSVLGLLCFSYYANRAAYFNLDICIQLVCITSAVLADRYVGDWKELFHSRLTNIRLARGAVSLALIVSLTVSATQIVFAVSPLMRKNDDNCYNTDVLYENAEKFGEIVPEDYIVLGCGASTYCLQLERKSEFCYRDFSDLYVGGDIAPNAIVADALKYGKVAFYLSTPDCEEIMNRILDEADTYNLVSEGTVGDVSVVCYEIN